MLSLKFIIAERCWMMLLQACCFFYLPIAAMFIWKEVFNAISGHLTTLLCMNLGVSFRNSRLNVHICRRCWIVPAFQNSCSLKRFTSYFTTRISSHHVVLIDLFGKCLIRASLFHFPNSCWLLSLTNENTYSPKKFSMERIVRMTSGWNDVAFRVWFIKCSEMST